ncbi:hypothetical protein ACO0QE_000899 [Hanseniaspora vineae]
MSKRVRASDSHAVAKPNRKQKYLGAVGIIEPGTSGIYATCTRGKERFAQQELMQLFEEKYEEMYAGTEEEAKDGESGDDEVDGSSGQEELDMEQQIAKELEDLKKQNIQIKTHKAKISPIELQCECVTFYKTRRPIVPEKFVHELMKDFKNSEIKRTRHIAKILPITNSCTATISELEKLCDKVLAAHFHTDEALKKPLKFAVDVTRRNFGTLERLDIIKTVAGKVGQNGANKHTVDLKNYDKLVIVECFKKNIGMSVVDKDYLTEFKRYNVQQIFESKLEQDEKNKQ